MGRLRLLSLTGVVAGMILGMGALTFGSSAQAQENVVEATVSAIVDAFNDQDAEAFVALWTEQGLEASFGPQDDYVEFIQGEMEATGSIVAHEVSDLRIEGGRFHAIVELEFEVGFVVYEEWEFIEGDEGWLVNNTTPAFREIPPGTPVVDMQLDEYAFIYNKDAINAADGNFAFDVTNVGEEPHEIIVVEITSDDSLLNLLLSSPEESEEPPEGIEVISFGGFFEPAQDGTVVFEEALSPGRYGLLCFVEASDGTPHAFLGMISEFTVGSGPVEPPAPTVKPGSGGGITAPNTGDAGLLDSGQNRASWLVLGLALTLVVGGTVGIVRSRTETRA